MSMEKRKHYNYHDYNGESDRGEEGDEKSVGALHQKKKSLNAKSELSFHGITTTMHKRPIYSDPLLYHVSVIVPPLYRGYFSGAYQVKSRHLSFIVISATYDGYSMW